jgi:hypothetical protein
MFSVYRNIFSLTHGDATLRASLTAMCRFAISVLLTAFGLATGFDTDLYAQSPAAAKPSAANPSAQAARTLPSAISNVTVTVLAGRDAANTLSPPSVIPPRIQVRDASNRPVTGAVVTFSSAREAPTVTFPNGSWSYSVVTDTSGEAVIDNMVPTGLGKFQIGITVTYLDSVVNSTISQTNYQTLKAATAAGFVNEPYRVQLRDDHGLSTGTKIGIAAAIAVAVGIGVYFAVRGHGSSNSVTAGTPTVGAPQ